MTRDGESAAVVQALVGLGRGLGLTIAAEGIAASDQEGALLVSGCEQGQADLLGGALSAAEAASLCAKRLGEQLARC